jgi:nucleoside-diphosphate-sugar epimerase
VPRSLSYTPDCAKAIYILSQHANAFNKTWILPSAKPALTGKQFIALASKYMNGKNSVQVLPAWLIGFIGLFNPTMKEIHEMLYQDKYGYVLDSSKFENTFDFVPTNYEKGIKATAEWWLKN